jgi:tetratricopeptide (TPR) repeat protein
MVINPYYPDWYRWNLGWAFYNAKDYDKALRSLNQIADPHSDVRLLLAAVYAQQGNTEAATAALQGYLKNKDSRYTIQDVKQGGCFKHQGDEIHWIEGLRKAGLPDA